MQIERLDDEQLKKYYEKLQEKLITGNYVLEANPFKPHIITVFEEFSLWRQHFFNQLQNVLKRNGSNGLIVVRYTPNNGKISFIKGHCLPNPLDWNTYYSLGFELDFIGNGAENLLFDDTCDWCIGTVVDVQFSAGNAESMDMLIGNKEIRAEKKMVFTEWANDPLLMAGYMVMPGYVKEE